MGVWSRELPVVHGTAPSRKNYKYQECGCLETQHQTMILPWSPVIKMGMGSPRTYVLYPLITFLVGHVLNFEMIREYFPNENNKEVKSE